MADMPNSVKLVYEEEEEPRVASCSGPDMAENWQECKLGRSS